MNLEIKNKWRNIKHKLRNRLMSKLINLLTLFVLIFVLISLSSQIVFSVGITPAKRTYSHDETLFSVFSIYNNENKDFVAEIIFEGDLKDYAKTKSHKIFIESNKKTIPFEVELKLPELKPGKHTLIIRVLESSLDSGNTIIGVTSSVEGVLEIIVPYDVKRFDARINTVSEKNNLMVNIPIINEGQEIEEIYAEVDIFDDDGFLIDSLVSDKKSLSINSQEILKAQTNKIMPGDYKITSRLYYDGETKELNEQIGHGQKSLRVSRININDFKEQNYVDLEIQLQNLWRGLQKGVYLNLEIYDVDQRLIDEVKSITFNLEKDEVKKVNLYWYVPNVPNGFYDGKLNIISEGLDESVSISININPGSISLYNDELMSKSKKNVDYLLIIVLIIILINVFFFVLHVSHMVKSKNNSQKKKKGKSKR